MAERPDSPPAPAPAKPEERGFLAWMTHNSVAANVLMLILVIGGALMAPQVRQEVMPQFELDMVVVQVAYPGASPEEVEQGVILPIEEAVRGIDGVREVRSTASESVGSVTLEPLGDADVDSVLADVKSAIDRVTSFPADAEEPEVRRPQIPSRVVTLLIHGDIPVAQLRSIAEHVREGLQESEQITQVDLTGVSAPEISVEVTQDRLRRFGLTHEELARAIREASVEVPAGALETPGGDVLLRTSERRQSAEELAATVIRTMPDGSRVTVGQLGEVVDGFADSDRQARFEGERAVALVVSRVGEQTPLEVAEAVRRYVDQHEAELPPTVHFQLWNDASEAYRERVDLLLDNAYIGLVLVLVCLSLFLEIRLAFWVTLGIPISFLGAFLFFPALGASLNMISLFAFILTLGMVVDDAIVVGESVYAKRREGLSPAQAAIRGTREVSVPVVFAVLTTCVAFAPLLFVPGWPGKFFIQIPIVVIVVMLLSLVESLLVLPAHLAHRDVPWPWWLLGIPALIEVLSRSRLITSVQQRVAASIERFIERVYRPILESALRWRYATVAAAVAMLLVTVGVVAGGHLEWTFMPKIDSEVVRVNVELPVGAPASETDRVLRRLEREARIAAAEVAQGPADAYVRGVYTDLAGGGSNTGAVEVLLVDEGERPFASRELAERWRERSEPHRGEAELEFDFSTGGPSTGGFDFRLSHRDPAVLERAATRLASEVERFEGVIRVDRGFDDGKPQLDFHIRPEARALGITESTLARQLRSSFAGIESVRLQRGRDEVRVYVRRPLSERRSTSAIEEFLVRTPDGGQIPLEEAAHVTRGQSYLRIDRVDGRRNLEVKASIAEGVNAEPIYQQVRQDVLPALLADHPGLRVERGGGRQSEERTLASLRIGFLFAVMCMYALLAIAFRSYYQPIAVLLVIPFGFIGAIGGHFFLGFDLSIVSVMGLVALTGVVVNDSLVLVTAVNERRAVPTISVRDAVIGAGMRRFRPIVLTSATTFLGLTPMLLETAVGARLLIPMAISLGFGVVFATGITLLLLPAMYLILEDVRALIGGVAGLYREYWVRSRRQS